MEELQLPQEEAKLQQQLNEQQEVLVGLDRLRSDRRLLTNLTDPEPPEGLIDDCLAAIERELLISDDPIAPPVHIQHRRFANWHRFAAAAVFFVIACIGIALIYQTIILAPNPLDFVGDTGSPNTAAQTESDFSGTHTFTTGENTEVSKTERALASGITSDQTPVTDQQPLVMNESLTANKESRISLPGNSDSSSITANDLSSEKASNHSDTTPSPTTEHPIIIASRTASNLKPLADDVPFSLPNQPSANSTSGAARDIGLTIRVAVMNRDEALDRIHALLNESTEISLIYNQPRLDTLPSNQQLNDDSYQYWSVSVNNNNDATNTGTKTPNPLTNSIKNNSHPSQSTKPSAHSPISSDADLALVPLNIQHTYRNRGFEYTLIGTPTRLHAFLLNMGAKINDLGRLRILRNKHSITKTTNTSTTNPDNNKSSTTAAEEKPISIESLMNPPHPRGRDWARSIFWWNSPPRNFPLAVKLVESYQPEPIIRVPLRIVGR